MTRVGESRRGREARNSRPRGVHGRYPIATDFRGAREFRCPVIRYQKSRKLIIMKLRRERRPILKRIAESRDAATEGMFFRKWK